MAKSKFYWEKEKKRGEKVGKKREKEKRKKKEEKREEKEKEKERKIGWGKETNQKAKQTNKQKETKQNTGQYPLILYTLSPLTSPGTGPSSWSSGGRACCADFQVLALGGAALPPPGAGLSGGCLPHEAPGGTTAVAGPALQPWSQLPQ